MCICIYLQEPQWGVKMEPIKQALTHVQGDNANKLAQGIFKMVGMNC